MALYINSESIARLYPHQDVVWLTVPILLYWISRMWVKAHRGEMHDDPVVFAMTDGLSLLTIAAFVARDGSGRCHGERRVSGGGCRAPHDVVALRRSPAPAAHRRQPAAGLPFGNGRSYGDVCLNAGGTLWATRGLDRFLAFDAGTGVLDCEAGVTLDEIIDLALPAAGSCRSRRARSSSPSAAPSPTTCTARTTTAPARFGDHVESLTLLRTDGSRIVCGPDASRSGSPPRSAASA